MSLRHYHFWLEILRFSNYFIVKIFNLNWNGPWLDDEKRLFKSFHLITRNAECWALSSQLRDISWRVSPADSSQLGSSPGASQAQAWAPSWVHSSVLSPGFVHPFIHQLTDDWAWQAWQYHHPTISNTQHWAHQTAYMASSLLWSVIGLNLKFKKECWLKSFVLFFQYLAA